MTWLTNSWRFGMPPLTARRHWEWRPIARPYDQTQTTDIAELGLRVTPGGANICLGGTATASEGTAANAFDAGPSTLWTPDRSGLQGKWIRVDLGTAQLPVEATVLPHPTLPQRTPTVYLLRQSDDGVTWSPVMVLEYPGQLTATLYATAVAQQDFTDVETNARAWRINVSAIVSGTRLPIQEIQFVPVYGGAYIGPQTNGAFCDDPTIFEGSAGQPRQAFDGNTATYTTANVALPYQFGFITASPVGVMEEVRISPAGTANEKITSMTVEWSVDGMNWHVKKSFSGITGWTNSTLKSFDLR